MTTTITAAGTGDVTVPFLTLGYKTTREGRNIVVDLVDGGIAVGLIPPRPRSGDLEFLYENEADAQACVAMHSVATSFALVDDVLVSIGMTYILDGSVSPALEDETRKLWTVTVSYQEIIP